MNDETKQDSFRIMTEFPYMKLGGDNSTKGVYRVFKNSIPFGELNVTTDYVVFIGNDKIKRKSKHPENFLEMLPPPEYGKESDVSAEIMKAFAESNELPCNCSDCDRGCMNRYNGKIAVQEIGGSEKRYFAK